MIILLLLGIVGSILLIIIGVLFLNWWVDSNDYPRIKFKSFKNFYELNPDRWRLYDSCVVCKTTIEYITTTIYGDHYDNFFFSFIDFYRYKAWKSHLDKYEQENVICKLLLE